MFASSRAYTYVLFILKLLMALKFLTYQFWRCWRREYIPQLVERSKWCFIQRDPRRGDLVLVADDNTSREK